MRKFATIAIIKIALGVEAAAVAIPISNIKTSTRGPLRWTANIIRVISAISAIETASIDVALKITNIVTVFVS